MSAPELGPALAELYARAPRGMNLGLDAVRAACMHFGNPERGFESVHIAGTNGKGSVSATIEAMARANGLTTGLYTSPHLCRFAERIRIGGCELDDSALAALLSDVLSGAPDLTFFEVTTVAAFLAFRAAKVDLAVLEVGIGGRLDATNVIPPPRVAAITRIAFDHMDKLGDTLVAIAREKAGIAKRGVPVVVGPLDEDVRREVDACVRAAGGTLHDAAADVEARDFVACHAMALAGDHQRDNARVACAVARHAGLSRDAMAHGLAHVQWPGRLERITVGAQRYLLDAAHNPDGARALATYLDIDRQERVLIFGALQDKPWPEMLDILAPIAEHRIYVAPPIFGTLRSAAKTPFLRSDESISAGNAVLNREGPGHFAPALRSGVPPEAIAAHRTGQTAASIDEALHLATCREVVVAGSIYLVGAVRSALLGLRGDPPIAL